MQSQPYEPSAVKIVPVEVCGFPRVFYFLRTSSNDYYNFTKTHNVLLGADPGPSDRGFVQF